MLHGCYHHGLNEIGFSIYLTCFIFLLIISITSIKQLIFDSEKIQNVIKCIYFLVTIFSIFVTLIALSGSLICQRTKLEIWITGFVLCYECMLLSVSGLLLLRLYFTFKESIFAITQCQKWFIIILYLFTIIAGLISFIFSNAYVALIGYCVGGTLYVVLTIYGMLFFSQKMYQLTKIANNENEIEFNQQQKKLLYTTTKYVTLLTIAILSSWIVFIGSTIYMLKYINHYEQGRGHIFYLLIGSLCCFDCMVNVICLYLQYPFNQKYYEKYCQCCARFCAYLFKKLVLKNMKQTDVESDVLLHLHYKPPIIKIYKL